MSKLKWSTLISAAGMMSIVLYGTAGISQPPQPTVQLTTQPSLQQILPFEAESTTEQSPVSLKLQALDPSGTPLKNARIGLTILTPPKTPWFPTDFPMVEGTQLLEIAGTSPNGELQIQQMLPIRGNYQLLVNVTPRVANAFTPIQQKLTLSVPENSLKYRNFGLLAFILLGVGLGGGWIIGKRQPIQLGEIAPTQVRLLLSAATLVAIVVLLWVNIRAEFASTEMPHTHSHSHSLAADATPGILQSQGLQVQILGDEAAVVGNLASFAVKVTDLKTNLPVSNVLLMIKTTQLEDHWISFAYQGVPDATGILAWRQQFFDGAPHQIEVAVSPQPNAAPFSPFVVSRTLEVEGIAPPLLVRLIVLGYFTGIVIIGLLLGLWLQRRRLYSFG